jgi:hypothetical protein
MKLLMQRVGYLSSLCICKSILCLYLYTNIFTRVFVTLVVSLFGFVQDTGDVAADEFGEGLEDMDELEVAQDISLPLRYWRHKVDLPPTVHALYE